MSEQEFNIFMSKNLFMNYVNPFVEIKMTPQKGRGIFATQKIGYGSLISAEKSLA